MRATLRRTCQTCDALLPQHDPTARAPYDDRRFCGPPCATLARRRHEADKGPPVVFPRAEIETVTEAPSLCDRCGGPWRVVPIGLACATCPRQLYVAATLRATAGAGRRDIDASRWRRG